MNLLLYRAKLCVYHSTDHVMKVNSYSNCPNGVPLEQALVQFQASGPIFFYIQLSSLYL